MDIDFRILFISFKINIAILSSETVATYKYLDRNIKRKLRVVETLIILEQHLSLTFGMAFKNASKLLFARQFIYSVMNSFFAYVKKMHCQIQKLKVILLQYVIFKKGEMQHLNLYCQRNFI